MSREVDSGDADSARLSECIFVAIAKAAQQRRTPYRSCRSVNCGDAIVRVRRQSQGSYAEARWPGARRFGGPKMKKARSAVALSPGLSIAHRSGLKWKPG